jgi:hypothetical protein
MKIFIVLLIAFYSIGAFSHTKIYCHGTSGKTKILMNIKKSIDDPNSLMVSASITGKLDMTGVFYLTEEYGVFQGPLTEYGDPLEITLVFPKNYQEINEFQVLLNLEDSEEITNFTLNCMDLNTI